MLTPFASIHGTALTPLKFGPKRGAADSPPPAKRSGAAGRGRGWGGIFAHNKQGPPPRLASLADPPHRSQMLAGGGYCSGTASFPISFFAHGCTSSVNQSVGKS